MEALQVIKGQLLPILFGGLAGICTAWVTQRVLNKRGLFSYFVTHNRVGLSSDDSIFGNVSVTWNENPVNHLFFSNIELKNESLNDYENVVIQTYTNTTDLLSESTHVLGGPNILHWTGSFSEKLHVEPGSQPTEAQRAIYSGQREYIIPVFNRGDQIRISYLNSAKSDEMPEIWLSASVKGVRVKFQVPTRLVQGVPQDKAGVSGVVVGVVLLIPFAMLVDNVWIVGFFALAFGLFAQLPGAWAIRFYRKAREIIGG